MPALLALLAVTAVWGVTFVQVKDAVELYPLFAFLALRFAIATATLAPAAARRVARGRLRAPDRGARADERLEHGLRDGDVRRADAGDRLRRVPRLDRRVGLDRRRARDGRARAAVGRRGRPGRRRVARARRRGGLRAPD